MGCQISQMTDFRSVEAAEFRLAMRNLASGKSVTLTFADIIAMDDGTAPQGLSFDEKSELEEMVAKRVADRIMRRIVLKKEQIAAA